MPTKSFAIQISNTYVASKRNWLLFFSWRRNGLELATDTEAGNQVLWTRNFLIHQEYEVGPALIYQDNLSTIHLVKNGRSNSERTRHIDIKFFFLHDRIKSDHIIVTYKSTKEMIAYLLTKPLQEKLFQELRDQVLNV